MIFTGAAKPKKRSLGPQNGSGSSRPEKLVKIVKYAETEKLKKKMVGSQVEYASDHQYPAGSLPPNVRVLGANRMTEVRCKNSITR